jgi:DNA-binding LacI/PurR family transcriptional regulator
MRENIWAVVDREDPIPRYQQVRRMIEDSIVAGRYAPGALIPGERTLAVDMGVSQMTVNKAIQALVQDGWLRREVGFGTYVREDFIVPGLKEARIGFAVPASMPNVAGDYYMGTLFNGLQRGIVGEPVSLSLIETPENGLYETLGGSPMDGFLLTDPPERLVKDINRLAREGRKVVVLGGDGDLVGVPTVDCDNSSGTRQAMEHLFGLGHTRIAGVFAYIDKSDSRHRREAYRDAMAERGLGRGIRCFEYSDDGPGLAAAMAELGESLAAPDHPTAFFCGGYFVALETIKVIQRSGLVVPDDVSVVGFDDPGTASYLSPPLTTVSQPLEDMGYRAMRRLMNWLLANEQPLLLDVLPTTFVERSSTAQAPGVASRQGLTIPIGDLL